MMNFGDIRVLIHGSITSKGLSLIKQNGSIGGGGWVENLVNALSNEKRIQLFVSCFSYEIGHVIYKKIDNVTYIILPTDRKKLDKCTPLMMNSMIEIKETIKPDVVHIIGTEREYDYRLAEICGFDRTVVSITGLVSVGALHYYGGIESKCFIVPSLGDLIRRGGPCFEKKQFSRWGRYERQLILDVEHVFGRTTWDYACVKQINPRSNYHFCGEIINPIFFSTAWTVKNIKRHRIFVSQGSYPLKGLHQIIKAFRIILDSYPDSELVVAGANILKKRSIMNRIKRTTYGCYIQKLIKNLLIPEERIIFTDGLSTNEMLEEYLSCNVFVLPSAIENSPNSLGEAMALGVPCVSSCVGGVQDMLKDRVDGYLYPFDEFYMLAYYVCKLFSDDKLATSFGDSARDSAKKRFNSTLVTEATMAVYQLIFDERHRSMAK